MCRAEVFPRVAMTPGKYSMWPSRRSAPVRGKKISLAPGTAALIERVCSSGVGDSLGDGVTRFFFSTSSPHPFVGPNAAFVVLGLRGPFRVSQLCTASTPNQGVSI